MVACPWKDGDIMSLGDCPCIVNGQLPATAQVASQQKVISPLCHKDYVCFECLVGDVAILDKLLVSMLDAWSQYHQGALWALQSECC